jgi:site-specific recombinase XerD
VHLTRRGLKPATRARRLHALRSFWRFLEETEQVAENPCRRLSVLLWRAAARAGVARPGVSLHTLRHSFATMLLHSQVDLFSLQKLLAHASIETTAVYLPVDLTRLRAVVASHPMA